jgi:hypothetical protein
MKAKLLWRGVLITLLLLSPTLGLSEEPGGTISYKIDGKAFSFKDATLEYSATDGYLTITREGMEEVADPSDPKQKTEINVGVSIEVAVEEKALVGVHEANSADTMPVYFSWYDIVADKETKGKVLKDYLASLDNGDEKKQSMRIKIDNWGAAGTVIKGSFSGKLFDEDAALHEVTEGTFAIPRSDIKD